MMRALYQIGRLAKSDSDDPLVDIVDPIEPGTHVIALELQTDKDGTVSLVNPEAPFRLLFEASAKNVLRIGYKKGASGKAVNITPAAACTFNKTKDKLDGNKPNIRTFDGKIVAFFRSNRDRDPMIGKIADFFEMNRMTEILRTYYYNFIEQNYASHPKMKRPKGRILTVSLDGKLPGELDAYKKLLYESKTSLIGSGVSEGRGICSLTFEPNSTVYGKASNAFSFYTIDKPGMITGGFDEKKAWKNFPVSAHAAQSLKQARDYLDKRQKFYMPGGFRYWVIPKLVFGGGEAELKECLESLASYSDSSPGFGLGQEARDRFSEIEQRIKFIAKLVQSQVLLSFLFWERNNAQLKINLLVDDVPPTRLKRLIEAQREVARLKSYSSWQNKISDKPDTDRSIRFSFGLIWPFYAREAQHKSKDNKFVAPRKGTRYRESYLRLVRELYLGYAPDARQILTLVMEYLEALYKDPEDKSFLYKPLHALCWLRYLCELDLWQPALKNKGDAMKLDDLSIEPDFKQRDESGRFKNSWMAYIEEFYQEHQAMLVNPFLFGTFLLGCLVRLMMNIQAHKLNSTPFEKELKGLRLKKSDIPTLFSKTLSKLRDYEHGDTYKVLDELISDLCLRGNLNEEQISDEEVSAWLAFGLAQGRVFKKLVDLEKERIKEDVSTSNNGEGE